MSIASPLSIAKTSVGWSIALSILMIVAGLLAIAIPPAAGLAVTVLVGWLLIFSGVAHLIFGWHMRTAGGMIWEILLGLLYIFIGGYILYQPVAGLESLTLALAIYLLIEAILEFMLGFLVRALPGSGWLIFDGIITLILAIMIFKTWPWSTAWVIGTLVGVSMLFSGISRLAISMAARRLMGKLA